MKVNARIVQILYFILLYSLFIYSLFLFIAFKKLNALKNWNYEITNTFTYQNVQKKEKSVILLDNILPVLSCSKSRNGIALQYRIFDCIVILDFLDCDNIYSTLYFLENTPNRGMNCNVFLRETLL